MQARGLAVKMPHPEAGEVPLVGSPIRLSKTPVEYRRAPPLVGEHTDEILADLGVDAVGIAGLRERGGGCRAPAPGQTVCGGQTSTVFYMSGHLSSVTIEDWFLTRWERV